MRHLIHLKNGDQVLHAISTVSDPHWFPTHKDLDIISDYFSLLRKLCEENRYPNREEMRRIRKLGRKTRMTRLLKVIYGNRFTAESWPDGVP